MDKNDIREAIARYRTQFASCYNPHLADEPTLAGKVEVLFTIGLDGTVTSATATGFHQGITDCVVRLVRAVRFPSPHGGPVKVRYPFHFHPRGQVENDDQRAP